MPGKLLSAIKLTIPALQPCKRSHPAAVQPVQSVLCDKCLQQFLAQVAIGLIVLSILLILPVPSVAMYAGASDRSFLISPESETKFRNAMQKLVYSLSK